MRTPHRARHHSIATRRLYGLLVAFICLVLVVTLSLMVGSRDVSPITVWNALTGIDTGQDAGVVITLRVPRTILGILVGVGLGIAGAVIQAVTRNPLADPGILGVNYGSAFAVAMAVGVLGATRPSSYLWFAFLGALVTTIIVFLIGSAGHGSVSPTQITLAGVAIGAVLSGVTNALILANPQTFNAIRAWSAGSFADRGWDVILPSTPFIVIGIAIAILLGPSLNALGLGEDLASALGSHVIRTRVLSLIAITLLAGASTAMAGPIAFIGLMTPPHGSLDSRP